MSEDLRVWNVDVELTVNVIVVAPTKEKAREAALDFYQEEIDNGTEPEASVAGVYEMTDVGDFSGVLPYGVNDDHPRRNWSIDQWLEKASKDDESDPAG